MKAYELLANPENWTKGNFAKDANNNRVSIDSPSAVKWCLDGALMKCYKNNSYLDMYRKLQTEHQNIVKWNDHPHTNHAMVIALLKKLDI